MNSLRSRRPPPNLNLIVANPDSDEDSSEEERRTAQNVSQSQVPSKILQQKQQGGGGNGQGVMITAQPPTPGVSGLPGMQTTSSSVQQRPGEGSSSHSYSTSGGSERLRTSMDDSTGLQYRSNASPPPPGSSAYPPAPAPPTGRPGSSGSQGPSPSTQLNNHPNAPSNWPVMMTTSNMRQNRHPAVERSLPRIHTPPAYPIPLPPTSVATARPNDFPSGVPAPQQQGQQQAQQQAYQQMTQKTVAGSIGGSPINTSSPSSPSMNYASSNLTVNSHAGQPGANVNSDTTHRRRHEGLPMLPSRPKQPVAPAQTSSNAGQSPQRLGSIRLAVTVDNENFSVVDVSGMASAEAIMERVFAKVSGGDLFRTCSLSK